MLNERESRIVGKRIGDYRRMHKLSQAELGAELFGISENDLLVDISEGAEEEKEMESKLVKELTEEIKKLKEENKNLEDRADMWKERVAEI